MPCDATLHHGDCLDVMAEIPDGSVDTILVDPPFSSGTRKEGSKGIRKSMLRGTEDDTWFDSDCMTTNGFVWLMRQCGLHYRRVLKRGGHLLIFIDWRMMPNLAGAIESVDLRHKGLLVWDKTYFGMGDCFRNQHELILHFTKGVGRKPSRSDTGNVLSFKPIRNGDHPTEKPVELLAALLGVVGRPGDMVLDSFCGSGSTVVAAARCGMRSIGIEKDAGYYEIARRRIREEDDRTALFREAAWHAS